MEVWALEPHGFCEGVNRAFSMAEEAMKTATPLYSLGLLIHNEKVIDALRDRGLVALDERNSSLESLLRGLPDGSSVLFSAHGHDPKLDVIAKEKRIKAIDSTCPYVKANMNRILWALERGSSVIYIGRKGHLECEAALSLGERVYLYEEPREGFAPRYCAINESKPYVIAQTTMDEDEVDRAYGLISARYPEAVYAGGRCPSTVRRQTSLIEAPRDIDVYVILGSERSNNTNRLATLVKKHHPGAALIRAMDKRGLLSVDFSKFRKAALASGTSTDPETYQEALAYLKSL
ncbi:MAG: hypothetical protein LKK13_03045 [Bacilli bacterium]|jgi:4-hydroxy-3-methylbut-2-enyl diphosphate reductase|nr:hypothetical protein [Bacilli bacterium]MCI2111302.1 hypothetical protein [Bacilli bacterium]